MPPRLAALLAVIFWGISFVATKAALREVAPVTLIFVRFVIGALLLLAFARSLPPRDALPQLALMGFIGVFVHQMLQSYGLTLTSATHAGWLVGTGPIFSAIVAAIVLRERFTVWKSLGLIGGFAGALLVITRGDLSTHVLALPSTKGDLLFLVSSLNWAIYSVVGHRMIRRLGAVRATSGAILCGSAMLAPFFVAQHGWRELPPLSAAGWTAILFLGVCCSGLGYLFWYGAIEKVEVSRVAAFLYLEPLVTFATAVILLHEPVSLVAIAGGLLVLASVIVMQAGANSAVADPESI